MPPGPSCRISSLKSKKSVFTEAGVSRRTPYTPTNTAKRASKWPKLLGTMYLYVIHDSMRLAFVCAKNEAKIDVSVF